jgi:V8-like Glu-specific endopeptidase
LGPPRSGRGGTLILCAMAVVAGVLIVTPATGAAGDIVRRIGTVVDRLTGDSGDSGQPFDGVAAVGALFTTDHGKLASHFCTASVVHSPKGDLALTAAHCVTNVSSPIVFVPGYHDGKTPYGRWSVIRVYTDPAWQSGQDPDDDVAFLRLANEGGVPIEDYTGAEQLQTGNPMRSLVQVIGYPDGAGKPVRCTNWTKTFSPTQLEFDCGGYPDGTSGGPFLTDVDPQTGQGTVMGVIGGYEQGGLTSSVSYAAVFGSYVAALYQTAASAS